MIPANPSVDRDLRAHDHANLFIVGGMVFPTAGMHPPTLTIAALALKGGARNPAELCGVALSLSGAIQVLREVRHLMSARSLNCCRHFNDSLLLIASFTERKSLFADVSHCSQWWLFGPVIQSV